MEKNETPVPTERVIGRRTIVKGAAWTIPVIATATAVPAASASVCTPQTLRVDGFAQATTIAIPACATTVTFTVAGGGGGGVETVPAGDGKFQGGSGALITGTLIGVAGKTLTLTPGNGGTNGVFRGASGRGGSGVGNGGDSGFHPTYGTHKSGGGGGGSAIMLGSTYLVVAGGGGGAGSDYVWTENVWESRPNGGDAGQPGSPLTAYDRFGTRASAGGGQPGAGGAGGVAGSSGQVYSATPSGNGGPRNGGVGGLTFGYAGGRPVSNDVWIGSGGGGGGWGGGGSGGILTYIWAQTADSYLGICGGGGGGGSYTDPTYTASTITGLAGNRGDGETSTAPGNGWIEISYS